MSYKTRFIGIDNGVTGTIGIIDENGSSTFLKTPVFKQQDYTKAKKQVSRIRAEELFKILECEIGKEGETMIMLERPLVNPQRWESTMSAMRSMEATIIIIELLGLPYEFLDSREWQKALLPKGVKGSAELKKASLEIGERLFPQHSELIDKHKDADGILIAEHCRRKYGGK